MADTNLNNFANGVASYLASSIFPAIVQGLAAKGINESVENLLNMTNTPVVRHSAIPSPTVPTMAFGGAVPPMSAGVAPTTRKTTATASPVAGRTCMYQFKRGEKKGMYCGKATAAGSDHCNACIKQRFKGQAPAATGPAPGAVPGMAGGVPGYGGPVANPPSAGASQPGTLSVVDYDPARNLYRDPGTNFIVTPTDSGVAVLGRLNEAENKIVPLTPQEQGVAQTMSLAIATGTIPAATPVANHSPGPVAAVAAPPVPAYHPPVAAPPIPTVGFHASPAGQPVLPTINQLNQLPAVPVIPTAVPTIPSVPVPVAPIRA